MRESVALAVISSQMNFTDEFLLVDIGLDDNVMSTNVSPGPPEAGAMVTQLSLHEADQAHSDVTFILFVSPSQVASFQLNKSSEMDAIDCVMVISLQTQELLSLKTTEDCLVEFV